MLSNGLEVCSCKRVKCKRFGKCQECISHHEKKKNPPFCKREKPSK